MEGRARSYAVPMHMVKNLTEGSPLKCILGFAAPLFLGLLFQQVYNMVDTMIVGRFLGLTPLAGVGATGSLYFLVIGSCSGICSGFAIPVSQAFGANDHTAVRRFVTNSIWLSIGFASVLTAITVWQCRNMLTLMNTPEEAFEYAYMYIVIIFAGIPTTFLYNISSSVIRALGDSRTPVAFLILSSLLNIGLDLLFIVTFNMNVAGASLATVISQLVAGVGCSIYMMRKFEILKMQPGDWKMRPSNMKNLCAVGLPMGLQYSITAIGSVAAQTAVNSFGSIAVAGVTAANKVYCILCCPMDAIGGTMATYAGQNIGAGKIERVNRGLKQASIVGICISVVLFFAALLFNKPMMMLFLDAGETEALSYASRFLLVTTAGFPLLTLVNSVRFTIQGMGYSTFAMIAGVLEMCARCFVAFCLSRWFGFSGVCFSNVCAWIAADSFLIPAFLHCRRVVVSSPIYGGPRVWKECDDKSTAQNN